MYHLGLCAVLSVCFCLSFLFFFNDTATTEIYTLSLHDALPICGSGDQPAAVRAHRGPARLHDRRPARRPRGEDRKSTRLNSSHPSISYAVFCLKKKKKQKHIHPTPNQILTKIQRD